MRDFHTRGKHYWLSDRIGRRTEQQYPVKSVKMDRTKEEWERIIAKARRISGNRMKTKEARYFICVGGFSDATLYFRYRGPGRGKSIHRDGSEHQSKISLRMALTSVKHGSWREITEMEARELLRNEIGATL